MSFARTYENFEGSTVRRSAMGEEHLPGAEQWRDVQNPNLTALGNTTRPRRAALKMSMAQMAREMQVSPATLSEFETKNENFPIAWLPEIGRILNFQPETLADLKAKRQISDLAKKDKSLLSDRFLKAYLRNRELISEDGKQRLLETLTLISRQEKGEADET
ncbi:hypothetical protein [Gymnodinialimonas sp.]